MKGVTTLIDHIRSFLATEGEIVGWGRRFGGHVEVSSVPKEEAGETCPIKAQSTLYDRGGITPKRRERGTLLSGREEYGSGREHYIAMPKVNAGVEYRQQAVLRCVSMYRFVLFYRIIQCIQYNARNKYKATPVLKPGVRMTYIF